MQQAQQLITILVEDNPTIVRTLVPALEEMACAQVVTTVATAQDAREAIEAWDGHWRLLVLDLFLASGSGLDVLKTVARRPANQYVFVLSNYATAHMRERCLALGANGVFDKSTELDAFFECCVDLPKAA
ncbi:MAG: response regulator [Pseudomonadota bacterium]